MDLLKNNLSKLLKHIEAFPSDMFLFKPVNHGTRKTMYCFEVLVQNKDKKLADFTCTFFFDCTTGKIYLEDYGTLYSGLKPVSTELQDMFDKAIQSIASFVNTFSELQFMMFQTTSRIPERFEFLEKAGFERKDQLNHYENFRFVRLLE